MANYAEAVTASHVAARGKGAAPKLSHLEVHHAENGGHIVEHHFEHGMGAYKEPEQHVFADGEGKKMLAHIGKHMGVKGAIGEKIDNDGKKVDGE